MLIDDVFITVKAGNGGNGSVHFKRNAQTAKGGPDGGNGGNGGNVYLQGVNDVTGLQQFQFRKEIQAENGINGGRQNMFGKNGKDLILPIPIGTQIIDTNSGNLFEINEEEKKFLISKGGRGGRGNNEFKTATNQTPMYAEKGEKGEEKKLHLILRLIADVGFIGLPNAGKSSLLKELTNAKPKIGNYPFTTLEPNLGVMDKIILADIPGLIEGASKGKGLGIKFLKHIEKTNILFHCIDSTDEKPLNSYFVVRQELDLFSRNLSEKKEIILLTKTDLISKDDFKEKENLFKKNKKEVYGISIYNKEELSMLKKLIAKRINSSLSS